MLSELRSGQALENGAAENALPAFAEDARRGGIELGVNPVRLESVEEAVLREVYRSDVVVHFVTQVIDAQQCAIRISL